MQALLTKSVVLVAVVAGLAACGSRDSVDDLASFCNAKVTLDKVQQTGTVGEFGPALKTFAAKLPDNATASVDATAHAMSASWDVLYSTYKNSGGDPDVKLISGEDPPPDLAGMRAEWTKELNRAKVQAVYSFADKECKRDGVS